VTWRLCARNEHLFVTGQRIDTNGIAIISTFIRFGSEFAKRWVPKSHLEQLGMAMLRTVHDILVTVVHSGRPFDGLPTVIHCLCKMVVLFKFKFNMKRNRNISFVI